MLVLLTCFICFADCHMRFGVAPDTAIPSFLALTSARITASARTGC